LPSLFLDLANASTHTNYLIQIVKEHLFSQKKSPCLTMTGSAQQRSGSLAVISTSWQALFNTFSSFFSAFSNRAESQMCSLHAGPAYYTLLLTVYIFFSKNREVFSFAKSLETSFPTPGAA